MIINKNRTSTRVRHRLTLQQEIRTADGAGGYTRIWQDIADVWGEIIPWKGKEIPYGMQPQSSVTHHILIRYREGVKAAQRLMYENRIFNIVDLFTTNELKETIQLLVNEGVAD